ncbi:hypothetical protein CZ771_07855 [Actinomycetales bacterium JB111]|nr:hypothetical protein CZ771_07855 [Actinomycetales bacterium JB111]
MSEESSPATDASRAWHALVDPDELGSLHRTAELITLVQQRDWPIDPAVLWVALTRAEPLAAWLGRPDADLGPGAKVAIAQSEDASVGAQVVEWQPGGRILLEWRAPGEDVAWVDLAMEPVVAADSPRTRLRLSYVAADEAQVRSAAVAWLSFLDVLGEITGAVPVPPDSTPALRSIERMAIAAQVIESVPIQER